MAVTGATVDLSTCWRTRKWGNRHSC